MWGWGQAAAGDRRGWLLVPVEAVAVGALVLVVPALAAGTAAGLATLVAGLVVAAWAAVPAHAWRRAAARRARLDLPPGGSGVDVLWAAPALIAGAFLLWGRGSAEEPGAVLDAYLRDWSAGRAADASARFVDGPAPVEVADGWRDQLAALTNELVRLAPGAGDDITIDATRPLDAVRWVDAGPGPAGGRLVAIEVARRETVATAVLGLPLTSQRLVPVARLGVAELRPVVEPGPAGLGGWNARWRLVSVEIGGIVVGTR